MSNSVPISKPEDMTHPLKCNPMNKDWKRLVHENALELVERISTS